MLHMCDQIYICKYVCLYIYIYIIIGYTYLHIYIWSHTQYIYIVCVCVRARAYIYTYIYIYIYIYISYVHIFMHNYSIKITSCTRKFKKRKTLHHIITYTFYEISLTFLILIKLYKYSEVFINNNHK